MFNAPIPGESLTKAPKSFPWERPPEYTDPEDVIQLYLSKLTDANRMSGIMDALEIGMTVKQITEGLLRIGVSEGIHSIDVSLLAAPVIHDYIKGVADEVGIEYDEGFVDKEAMAKEEKQKNYLKTKVRIQKMMEKKRGQKASPETTKAYEASTPTETPSEAPEALPEAPEGMPDMGGALVPRRMK